MDSDVDEDSNDCGDGDETNDIEDCNRGVDFNFVVDDLNSLSGDGEDGNSVESRGEDVIFETASITPVFLIVSGNDNGDDADDVGVVRNDKNDVEKNGESVIDLAVAAFVTKGDDNDGEDDDNNGGEEDEGDIELNIDDGNGIDIDDSGSSDNDDDDGVADADNDDLNDNDDDDEDNGDDGINDTNIGVTDDEADINSSADSDATFRDDDKGTTYILLLWLEERWRVRSVLDFPRLVTEDVVPIMESTAILKVSFVLRCPTTPLLKLFPDSEFAEYATSPVEAIDVKEMFSFATNLDSFETFGAR